MSQATPSLLRKRTRSSTAAASSIDSSTSGIRNGNGSANTENVKHWRGAGDRDERKRAADETSEQFPRVLRSTSSIFRTSMRGSSSKDSGDDTLEMKTSPHSAAQRCAGTTGTAELPVCAICLETVRDPAQLNSCTHVFCTPCITEWSTKFASSCPLCKVEITSFSYRVHAVYCSHYIPDCGNTTASSPASSRKPFVLATPEASRGRRSSCRCPMALRVVECRRQRVVDNDVPPELLALLDGVLCSLCTEGDHEELLLLCDACDTGFHTFCLSPMLSEIPVGEWFCPDCYAARHRQAARPSSSSSSPSITAARSNASDNASAASRRRRMQESRLLSHSGSSSTRVGAVTEERSSLSLRMRATGIGASPSSAQSPTHSLTHPPTHSSMHSPNSSRDIPIATSSLRGALSSRALTSSASSSLSSPTRTLSLPPFSSLPVPAAPATSTAPRAALSAVLAPSPLPSEASTLQAPHSHGPFPFSDRRASTLARLVSRTLSADSTARRIASPAVALSSPVPPPPSPQSAKREADTHDTTHQIMRTITTTAFTTSGTTHGPSLPADASALSLSDYADSGARECSALNPSPVISPDSLIDTSQEGGEESCGGATDRGGSEECPSHAVPVPSPTCFLHQSIPSQSASHSHISSPPPPSLPSSTSSPPPAATPRSPRTSLVQHTPAGAGGEMGTMASSRSASAPSSLAHVFSSPDHAGSLPAVTPPLVVRRPHLQRTMMSLSAQARPSSLSALRATAIAPSMTSPRVFVAVKTPLPSRQKEEGQHQLHKEQVEQQSSSFQSSCNIASFFQVTRPDLTSSSSRASTAAAGIESPSVVRKGCTHFRRQEEGRGEEEGGDDEEQKHEMKQRRYSYPSPVAAASIRT